ncbi:MAG: ATP-binding protein [Clostridia bacterium]|nr:ATP-binding protein [Clostridia bacterium]
MFYELTERESIKAAIDALCLFLEEEGASAEKIFDSKLVATELVENVFRHTLGTACLESKIENGKLELKVYSSAGGTPPTVSRRAEVFAESGRGLFLIDSVCVERTQQEGLVRVLIELF